MRAKRHIFDLQTETDSFLARDPYRIVCENNPETVKPAWIVRIRENFSDEVPLIIGDAVHNLRSALDLLACDLVRLNGKSTKGVAFPFAKDRIALETEIKNRKIRRAGPEIVRIVKSQEPHKEGNQPLCAIHDLDITDKHKLILPTVFLGGVPDVRTTFQSGTMITFEDCFICPVHHGLLINVIAASADVVGDQLNARFDIAFGDIEVFKNAPIVPTLLQLAQLVEGIIQTFETHILGEGKDG
jgi:hypothetical protein